jgi:hypothetical protein
MQWMAHLPAVHRLLDGASRDEAVDIDIAPLADAERPVHGLCVARRQDQRFSMNIFNT